MVVETAAPASSRQVVNSSQETDEYSMNERLRSTQQIRDSAPVITMDLSRPNRAIQTDLRTRWPNVINLWWELDEGDQTGWVYSNSQVLAKLQHTKAAVTR